MNNPRSADEDIVLKVLRGDVDLYRIIVERYQKRIFSMGLMFHKNADDASDFTQEVFIRAFDRLGSFRGDAKFYYWLVRLAYNYGINAVKGKRPTESLAESWVCDSEESIEEAQEKDEVRKLLARAVAELPEKYRVCVDLYFFYQLSYGEISEVTGFPVNTIKSHVSRAKRMLRDALKGTIVEEYHAV